MSRARPRGGAVPTGAEANRPCVLYARVSSREQEVEGFSVPSQSRLLHGYCQAHQLDPVKEFVDVESAKNPGARDAFGEMLTFLRRNRTVRDAVCEKTDRFYRNFRDYVSVDELQVPALSQGERRPLPRLNLARKVHARHQGTDGQELHR